MQGFAGGNFCALIGLKATEKINKIKICFIKYILYPQLKEISGL
jgi:hypothetical protein